MTGERNTLSGVLDDLEKALDERDNALKQLDAAVEALELLSDAGYNKDEWSKRKARAALAKIGEGNAPRPR